MPSRDVARRRLTTRETSTTTTMTGVKVTFAAPTHFLSSDHWSQIRTGLSSQLPLRDIQWSPPSRASSRNIPTLDVKLVALDSVREETASQVPVYVLERPLLNVYVVACDVSGDVSL